MERLAAIAEPLGARYHALDVTDDASVAAFCATLDRVDVLVNNAGNAFGAESLAASVDDKWRAMFELNVLGVLRMTRTLLPKLVASGDGLVVNLGSIAGVETYPGGGGYAASKFAVHALTRTLRLELLGQPVRVTEILPGLAETEFALVRFEGDRERAKKVYEGMTPLSRRGHRRGGALGRDPAVARRHRRDRHPAARPGDDDAGAPTAEGVMR